MVSLTRKLVLAFLYVLLFSVCFSNAQLSANFYGKSCRNLQIIVRTAMIQAVNREARLGASILRLFFHDCLVNGCDASILLDDTSTFIGEKNAFPNRNSARGYEVIDTIKTRVEATCPNVLLCRHPCSCCQRRHHAARRAIMGSAIGPKRRKDRKPK